MVKVKPGGADRPKGSKATPTPQELRAQILARHELLGTQRVVSTARWRGFWTVLKETIWSVSLAILAAGVIFSYLTDVDFSHFAPEIEQTIGRHMHLTVHLNGPVNLAAPITRPSIVFENISIGAAPDDLENAGKILADIPKLTLAFNPGKTFSADGRVTIDEVTIEGATIYLGADGGDAFMLGPFIKAVRALLQAVPSYFGDCVLREIIMRDSVFVRRTPAGNQVWSVPVTELRLTTRAATTFAPAPLDISWMGKSGDQPVILSGALTNYSAWLQGEHESGLRLTGTVKGIDIHASGTVSGMIQPQINIDVEFVNESDDADDLHIYGHLQGRLMDSLTGAWTGLSEEYPLNGQFSLRFGNSPFVALDSSSGVLDAAALSEFARTFSFLISPDHETLWQQLSAMEVRVHLQTEQMRVLSQVLGPTVLNVSVSPGALTADIWQKTPGGEINATLSVIGQEAPVLNLSLSAENINLARLTPLWDEGQDGAPWFEAPLLASTDLVSHGEEWNEILKNLSGEGIFILGEGKLNKPLARLIPSNDQGEGAFNCLITGIDIDGGIVSSKMLWAETDSSVITGSGRIDIPAATLEFLLRPRPKDPRALAGAVDLVVRGPLLSPIVEVREKGLARGLSGGLGHYAVGRLDEPAMRLLKKQASQDNACLEAWTEVMGNGKIL